MATAAASPQPSSTPAPERAGGAAAALPNLFVVPTYNEVENLPRLFAELEARPEHFPPGSRLFVVDDGSADGTADLAERYAGPLPVEVIRLGVNQGPGAAFRAGFAAALESCGSEAFVITLEADTTADLGALDEMLERAAAGAEVVLADWVMVGVGPLRRVLTKGAALVVRALLGLEAQTVSSFFRVYRASALRSASERYGAELIRESGFACKAELLTKLARLGARIDEVPVALDTSRRIGRSKMPILRTTAAYWRMVARERRAVLGA